MELMVMLYSTRAERCSRPRPETFARVSSRIVITRRTDAADAPIETRLGIWTGRQTRTCHQLTCLRIFESLSCSVASGVSPTWRARPAARKKRPPIQRLRNY